MTYKLNDDQHSTPSRHAQPSRHAPSRHTQQPQYKLLVSCNTSQYRNEQRHDSLIGSFAYICEQITRYQVLYIHHCYWGSNNCSKNLLKDLHILNMTYLAFISTTLYPAWRATIWAKVVLPSPGGPLTSATWCQSKKTRVATKNSLWNNILIARWVGSNC